ncbi:leucine-rich repeats and immunoglobulin-like domains protein 3 [Petromyzon marinus]|uniref:leucine-rich repeats and immunoglobulin-like domains protein 3 n=1 Tax=Petromyzon marinus TaxID=7757 RepID=UPI003F6F79AC
MARRARGDCGQRRGARWTMPPPLVVLLLLVALVMTMGVVVAVGVVGVHACPESCRCRDASVDCAAAAAAAAGGLPRSVTELMQQLPVETEHVDLSNNQLEDIDAGAMMSRLLNLKEVKVAHNELTEIASFGKSSENITVLSLQHNRIARIRSERLEGFRSLETLDLSFNRITDIAGSSFPIGLPLAKLYLNNNRIKVLRPASFDTFGATLKILKLSNNRITVLTTKLFQLPSLQHLDLSRNRLQRVEGLAFSELASLEYLRLQRNRISSLMDGAFWGLHRIQKIQLQHNRLTEVSTGWLYGLQSLRHLHVSRNAITAMDSEAWKFCENLWELDLSHNGLTRLNEAAFVELGALQSLSLAHNAISHIVEGAFRGLSSLRILDLGGNQISWTVEDMQGAFTGLSALSKLSLHGNQIKSIAKKAFVGLERLGQLDLMGNAIVSIQANAFNTLKLLHQMKLNTSELLCDCQLKWLPGWLTERGFAQSVAVACAHPAWLKGRSVLSVRQENFVCDDYPKPHMVVHPETRAAVRGSNVSFMCSAASSSESPVTFLWRKDNAPLAEVGAEVERLERARPAGGGLGEFTSYLHLRTVDFHHEGRYQCVISNSFGSSYSGKARLTVSVLPSFTKTPADLSLRVGSTARLECAAGGHPTPQISWQKDGGTDFPAARERRMHVMPTDDVFFIVELKADDAGTYSCIARNAAGTMSANASLSVLETPWLLRPVQDRAVAAGETAVLQCIAGGSPPPRLNWTKDDGPLLLTERHFFAASYQLLVIVNCGPEDTGRYTCELSNTLGTMRGHAFLSVLPPGDCPLAAPDGSASGGGGSAHGTGGVDSSATVGVVVIAVVCCVVGTSVVWVAIIYHTRRKTEAFGVGGLGKSVCACAHAAIVIINRRSLTYEHTPALTNTRTYEHPHLRTFDLRTTDLRTPADEEIWTDGNIRS